jgi:hypothetical protein
MGHHHKAISSFKFSNFVILNFKKKKKKTLMYHFFFNFFILSIIYENEKLKLTIYKQF